VAEEIANPPPALLLTRRLGDECGPEAAGGGGSLRLPLAAEERTRLRGRRLSRCGRPLLLQLPRGEALRPGEWLAPERGGPLVHVEAAPEALLVARAATPLALLEAAYHLGNRHVALELREGELRLSEDPVLADLLARRGLTLERRHEPFLPQPGAYAGLGHGPDHSHGQGSSQVQIHDQIHDHSYGHGHYHHSHGSSHDHDHDHSPSQGGALDPRDSAWFGQADGHDPSPGGSPSPSHAHGPAHGQAHGQDLSPGHRQSQDPAPGQDLLTSHGPSPGLGARHGPDQEHDPRSSHGHDPSADFCSDPSAFASADRADPHGGG
jgi:urease accessory protein